MHEDIIIWGWSESINSKKNPRSCGLASKPVELSSFFAQTSYIWFDQNLKPKVIVLILFEYFHEIYISNGIWMFSIYLELMAYEGLLNSIIR